MAGNYRHWFLLSIALLILGCAGQAPLNEEAEIRVADYHCIGHEPISVRYFVQQEQAELLLQGQVYYLIQQPVASGFWYTDNLRSLRGKGNELRLEVGRRAAIKCQAE